MKNYILVIDSEYSINDAEKNIFKIIKFFFDKKANIYQFSDLNQINNLNYNDFDAVIVFSKLKLNNLIENFHKLNKPIATIGESCLIVASLLQNHRPIVAVPTLITQKSSYVQYEICPAYDFITDRDCKLLSTPAYLDSSAKTDDIEKGIQLMFKELWEMS